MGFMQRYFDEYRGLRSSIGHVETIGVRSTVRDVRALVGHDIRWMRERDYPSARAHALGRPSATHHAGRKLFSALGSRAETLPPGLRRRLSFEGSDYAPSSNGHAHDAPAEVHRLPLSPQPARIPAHEYAPIARVLADGPAPLSDTISGMADRERLHLAFVIPPSARAAVVTTSSSS